MNKKRSIFHLLKPYLGIILLLIVFTLLSNSINLLIPKLWCLGGVFIARQVSGIVYPDFFRENPDAEYFLNLEEVTHKFLRALTNP